MHTVAVTGASSQLGVFLLPRLQAAGYRVEAYSRKAPPDGKEISAQLSWQRPRPDSCCDNIYALVSCGPLALADAMVSGSRSLDRVVAFSTTSVLSKADSGNREERSKMAKIITAENRLKSACRERGAGLLLLRPTLIYGCGLDRNISLLARFGMRYGFIPMAGNASGLRQPVHADDLAALVVHALDTETAPDLESAACGGSTLTYREMVIDTAQCLEGVRAVAIPAGFLSVVARLASMLPAYRELNSEMVRRQACNLVFDDSPLHAALPYAPREFRPVAGDFEIPRDARELQLG